jgi:hypothetical protein
MALLVIVPAWLLFLALVVAMCGAAQLGDRAQLRDRRLGDRRVDAWGGQAARSSDGVAPRWFRRHPELERARVILPARLFRALPVRGRRRLGTQAGAAGEGIALAAPRTTEVERT